MGLLNKLLAGDSKLGWNGGPVPPEVQPNVEPNPPGSRHDEYSINGNPSIKTFGAGFVAPLPNPSQLEESDSLNTSKYRNKEGQKYLDNPPG